MKVFAYGKSSVGDKAILKNVKDSLKTEIIHLGEFVDLSKIEPGDNNLIIVINSNIFNLDLDRVLGYIKKDLEKPLVVVKKLKTFAAISFKPNLEIEDIITNKLYVFAGILYLPKRYLKTTISAIFREIDKKDLRVYIIGKEKRG
jgi:hypothetical protein